VKTAFIDVDTQIDFVFPAGALYVPGAERILPLISELNLFASSHGIPLVSTVDAHAEDDQEFHSWPPHCILGTVGQLKPQSTHVPGQILFEKTTTNAFASPKFAPLLDEIGAERYVVYGVVTEVCVRHAALGLLRRGGARVEVITDAIRSLNQAAADAMFAEFTAQGGVLTTTSAVLNYAPAESF
jgi:nicotinamidase/pyrazinamidase